MPNHLLLCVAFTSLLAAVPADAQPQAPWKGENLQYFPKDIERPALVQRMREFSFALGVRCQHCHFGGDGISFDGVNFASDEKLAKVKARAMLGMVDRLNSEILPTVPHRAEPRVSVECVTCHRGLALPKTLQTTLFETAKAKGGDAAVAQYRELRREHLTGGSYDFGEWETNELARRLVEADNREAAIKVLELNAEFHPESSAIDYQLGELYLQQGDRAKALIHFQASLAKDPNAAPAKRRIAELSKPEPRR